MGVPPRAAPPAGRRAERRKRGRSCRLRRGDLPPMPCSRPGRCARMGEVGLAGWGIMVGLERACVLVMIPPRAAAPVR